MSSTLNANYIEEIRGKVKGLLDDIPELDQVQRSCLQDHILQSILLSLNEPMTPPKGGNTVIAVDKWLRVAETKYGLHKGSVWKIVKVEYQMKPVAGSINCGNRNIAASQSILMVKLQAVSGNLGLWFTYDQVKELLEDALAEE